MNRWMMYIVGLGLSIVAAASTGCSGVVLAQDTYEVRDAPELFQGYVLTEGWRVRLQVKRADGTWENTNKVATASRQGTWVPGANGKYYHWSMPVTREQIKGYKLPGSEWAHIRFAVDGSDNLLQVFNSNGQQCYWTKRLAGAGPREAGDDCQSNELEIKIHIPPSSPPSDPPPPDPVPCPPPGDNCHPQGPQPGDLVGGGVGEGA